MVWTGQIVWKAPKIIPGSKEACNIKSFDYMINSVFLLCHSNVALEIRSVIYNRYLLKHFANGEICQACLDEQVC